MQGFNFGYDVLVLAGFAGLFAIPVAREIIRKRRQPAPRGATKI